MQTRVPSLGDKEQMLRVFQMLSKCASEKELFRPMPHNVCIKTVPSVINTLYKVPIFLSAANKGKSLVSHSKRSERSFLCERHGGRRMPRRAQGHTKSETFIPVTSPYAYSLPVKKIPPHAIQDLVNLSVAARPDTGTVS